VGLFKKAAKAFKKVTKSVESGVKENLAEIATFGPQIGSGLGLYKKYEEKKAEKKFIKQQYAEKESLLQALPGAGIDKQTEGELRSLLASDQGISNLGQAQSIFEKARLGVEPKYKARKATEALYTHLVDMPGSRQTRDTGIASLLTGNAFLGRGR
jgi:hypothetical protein